MNYCSATKPIVMVKMAYHTVVLCSPLCFLLKKFESGQVELLRSALVEFYDADAITTFKLRLFEDISHMDLPVKPPHVPAKRCGENHTVQDVDDIRTLFKYLDENLLLYVNCQNTFSKVLISCQHYGSTKVI
jgi:hypothetical protein